MCNYRMWVGSEGRRPAVSYFDGDRVPRRARAYELGREEVLLLRRADNDARPFDRLRTKREWITIFPNRPPRFYSCNNG